jgi:hypothetical protein
MRHCLIPVFPAASKASFFCKAVKHFQVVFELFMAAFLGFKFEQEASDAL